LNRAELVLDDAKVSAQASGDWVVTNPDMASPPARPGGDVNIIDGSGLTALDTAGAWTLLNLMASPNDASQLQLRNFNPQHLSIMQLVTEHFAATEMHDIPRPPTFRAQLGRGTLTFWGHLSGLTSFVGRLTFEIAALARRPDQFRWRELGAQLQAVFVNAIPITLALIFLLGVVFAYLMGVQAQKYGANIFVVDGVAAAICRELSPVIVAILVAGRTGAAITAQLGTMKVTEEIDAITTLGLSPYVVLVVPRLLALVIALPLLVFLGDIAGLLGGMVVAQQQLDIAGPVFMDRLSTALEMHTVLIGLGKAPVFAAFIGLIACRMGFAAKRDAQSVGVNTTSTVVQSIVAVIVLNAIFAIIFVQLDM
jgi:phospholipid/cholesterol/gamma-HCH transport system permease protein